MEPDWAKWIRENMPKALYTQAQSSWARTGRILNDVISERDRLREAIEAHRRDMWGDEPTDHQLDNRLYAALKETEG